MSMVEAAVTKTINQQSDPKPKAKPKSNPFLRMLRTMVVTNYTE